MFEETGVLRKADIGVMIHPPVETKGLSRPEEKKMCLEVEQIVRDGVKKLQQG